MGQDVLRNHGVKEGKVKVGSRSRGKGERANFACKRETIWSNNSWGRKEKGTAQGYKNWGLRNKRENLVEKVKNRIFEEYESGEKEEADNRNRLPNTCSWRFSLLSTEWKLSQCPITQPHLPHPGHPQLQRYPAASHGNGITSSPNTSAKGKTRAGSRHQRQDDRTWLDRSPIGNPLSREKPLRQKEDTITLPELQPIYRPQLPHRLRFAQLVLCRNRRRNMCKPPWHAGTSKPVIQANTEWHVYCGKLPQPTAQCLILLQVPSDKALPKAAVCSSYFYWSRKHCTWQLICTICYRNVSQGEQGRHLEMSTRRNHLEEERNSRREEEKKNL